MSETVAKVLVVDDEAPVRRFLYTLLDSNGFRVFEARTGAEGLAEASMRSPDVILLDLGLPDVDGLEVTRRIREWSQTPIIVLSARGQERDKVDALNEGADDYLTKPFGAEELLARLRVALRHAAQNGKGASDPVFQAGGLKIDFAARRVFVDRVEVHLTPTEYKLLGLLSRHAGKVVTHTQLLKDVWGPAATQMDYIRVYMRMLRHKIEKDPTQPRFLINEPGIGYRLKVD
jgi:two-component system, OmpR family, KDP operon response regulator KdpE